jgi:hypothetical protein
MGTSYSTGKVTFDSGSLHLKGLEIILFGNHFMFLVSLYYYQGRLNSIVGPRAHPTCHH